MLGDWTQDYDPHAILFDEALATLRNLGQPGVLAGPCLAHFELVLLRELGYGPALDFCADCGEELGQDLAFSAAGGGVLCSRCQPRQRERRPLSEAAWRALKELQAIGEAWRTLQDAALRNEIRQLLNHYVTYLLGRRPRLLPYLGS
jgi:DNA repair protein RecO